MAIEYSLKVKEVLSEEALIQVLESLGYKDIAITYIPNGITIDHFRDTLGLTLSLVKSGDYPYNAVDTMFLSEEFSFDSTISIRLTNSVISDDCYKFILLLVFSLMDNVKTDAIFLSNGDNELCIFYKSKLYLENASRIWNKGYFADVIHEREYSIFDGNPLEI